MFIVLNLLNSGPVLPLFGRNCSQEERIDFEKYDNVHHVRAAFVRALKEKFPEFGLQYSIGGQISFDVFPIGWDKTYCLKHISEFSEIHFFGDKTMPGGNDYEIFTAPGVKGHSVTNPEDTFEIVSNLFLN